MPINYRILLPLTLLLTTSCSPSDTPSDTELKTTEQRFSYAVGYTFATQLKSESIKIDDAAIAAAISDVLQGRELQMTAGEMAMALEAGQQAILQARAEEAKRTLEAGQKFLAENKSKEGVVELPSGLQYEVLKAGEGASPKVDDTVSVHYRGTLLNGEEFDSSYSHGEQPVTFPLNGVIEGFREALTRMQPGAKWRIFIPSEMAYGARGAPPAIGPNEALIFEIELISIKTG